MDTTNKPVAWMNPEDKNCVSDEYKKRYPFSDVNELTIPLYTHPAKTLTDEEIEGIARANVDGHSSMEQLKWFARAILKKASEK